MTDEDLAEKRRKGYTVDTLGVLIDHGYKVALYCENKHDGLAQADARNLQDAAFRPLCVGTSTMTETSRDPQFGQRIRPDESIEIGQSLPRVQIKARRSTCS